MISNLWTKAKKCLKIELKKEDFPDFVFKIISGLDTSLGGLKMSASVEYAITRRPIRVNQSIKSTILLASILKSSYALLTAPK